MCMAESCTFQRQFANYSGRATNCIGAPKKRAMGLKPAPPATFNFTNRKT